MDCSRPGFPVHHQLLEFTQTYVRWVSDSIQPSYLLSSPSPPSFNLSQHLSQLFASNGQSIGVSASASVLPMNIQHWSPLGWTGLISLISKGLARVFSSTAVLSEWKSLGHVWLFATPWTAACQASLSITNSWSMVKLMSVESVMASNYLIVCWPLLLPPSMFPSIGVFSNESVLHIRWPNYWSFSFSINHSNE